MLISKNELVGTGRYTWSNGSTYEGGVYGGLRDGEGTFTSADGTLVRDLDDAVGMSLVFVAIHRWPLMGHPRFGICCLVNF